MAFTASRSTFTGDKALIRRLEGLARSGRQDRKGLRSAVLGTITDLIFEPSQERVPVKTGRTKRSGKPSVRVGEKQFVGKVRYGGKLAPWAVIVHEMHPTKAKFLESVAIGAIRAVGPDLAKRIDLARAAA